MEDERLAVLRQAVQLGAAFVDVELKAADAFFAGACRCVLDISFFIFYVCLAVRTDAADFGRMQELENISGISGIQVFFTSKCLPCRLLSSRLQRFLASKVSAGRQHGAHVDPAGQQHGCCSLVMYRNLGRPGCIVYWLQGWSPCCCLYPTEGLHAPCAAHGPAWLVLDLCKVVQVIGLKASAAHRYLVFLSLSS